MKDKSLLAIILVLIAGIASFAALGCNRGAIRAQAASTEAASSNSRDAKVVAYYFHGTSRCYTCRKIESQSHDIITSEFGSQLKANRLEWQSIDVDQPGNEHFFKDYKLVSWSLVLVTYKNGKQLDYKVLNDVWKLVNNEQAFRSYIKGGIQVALERIS